MLCSPPDVSGASWPREITMLFINRHVEVRVPPPPRTRVEMSSVVSFQGRDAGFAHTILGLTSVLPCHERGCCSWKAPGPAVSSTSTFMVNSKFEMTFAPDSPRPCAEATCTHPHVKRLVTEGARGTTCAQAATQEKGRRRLESRLRAQLEHHNHCASRKQYKLRHVLLASTARVCDSGHAVRS